MVSSPLFFFPFLACEAISQKKEEDQYRMLLQAIAVARAGQFLMVDGALKTFFVVAYYLCRFDCGKICYHPYYTDRKGSRGLSCCCFVFFCSCNGQNRQVSIA